VIGRKVVAAVLVAATALIVSSCAEPVMAALP
jgi:hypothetical protein